MILRYFVNVCWKEQQKIECMQANTNTPHQTITMTALRLHAHLHISVFPLVSLIVSRKTQARHENEYGCFFSSFD